MQKSFRAATEIGEWANCGPAARTPCDAAEADSKITESKTRIGELNTQMRTMIDKKVGPNTTVEDVYAAYPEIEKEIDEEIDQHQWSKDVN